MKKNYFITVEGIEGVGKSTSIHYIKQLLDDAKIAYISTREPGGTEIAEKIRTLLLQHHKEKMHIDTELLLFFAGRAQHYHQVIKPALEQGKWVLCDRFTDASFAYQCGGRGIAHERIAQLAQWTLNNFHPDITILLYAPVKLALTRANSRSRPDRIEAEKAEFFEQVQNAYLERAKNYKQRFRLVNSDCTFIKVKQQLSTIINTLITTTR